MDNNYIEKLDQIILVKLQLVVNEENPCEEF